MKFEILNTFYGFISHHEKVIGDFQLLIALFTYKVTRNEECYACLGEYYVNEKEIYSNQLFSFVKSWKDVEVLNIYKM